MFSSPMIWTSMLAIHSISAQIPEFCVPFFLADMSAMVRQAGWNRSLGQCQIVDAFYATNDPNDCEKKALAEEIIKTLLAHNLACISK